MTERPPYGLLLRLAGPMQAWGTRSKYQYRDTARFPTRSGVLGMLAAALGWPREELRVRPGHQDGTPDRLSELRSLSMFVRVDRPGVVMTDFHTVGGGNPPDQTVITAEGKRRGAGKGTLASWRQYLADAAFTVALCGDVQEQLARYADALQHPRWPPYLGRRSCPPAGPLFLGFTTEPLHHLVHLPLAAPLPGSDEARQRPVRIEFYSNRKLNVLPVNDGAVDSGDGDHHSGEVADEPDSFVPLERAHSPRLLYRRSLQLPGTQRVGYGTRQLEALRAYQQAHLNRPEGGFR
ncbi:type I-E CRISPR-associated protein Cas5/CasD [Streptomyces cacaoi]|uniref:type I-E CRISPR-associated protein Cas5/CasD n=1 Tax=Streptomyces cacaoi TaxID=1898 RepID=UPI0037480A8A